MNGLENKPQLWIIAGPNGSGKSTLVERYFKFLPEIPFINPDNIARKLEPHNTTYPSTITKLKAGKIAIKEQHHFLLNKQSFGFETTFSGNRELAIIKTAKKEGFKINLVFVGLDSPAKNIIRVEERVEKGGHFVETKDIIRRYYRSLENIKNNFYLLDRLYVFDNSYKKHNLQLSINNNKIKYLSKDASKWISTTFNSIITKHKNKSITVER